MIRKHLDKLLDKLFGEFTGIHYHVAWTPATAPSWDARSTPTDCSVCCRLAETGSRPWAGCRTCGPRHLAATLKLDQGHHFICRLGVRNYWLPIRVRDETLGIAYLQALDRPAGQSPARKPAARAVRHRLDRGATKVLSRLKFARAARLLQFVIRSAQTSSQSDLRKADLTGAGHTAIALEKELGRLHATLKRFLPATRAVLRRSGPESHPEQIVHQLQEWMDQDYAKPISLKTGAGKLGMNAAYLSALFSRLMGIPFKTYLTELRLEKAKELLTDPAQTAAGVAYAVGYAGENRFRAAFKKATGLAPKLWREAMQVSPLAAFRP